MPTPQLRSNLTYLSPVHISQHCFKRRSFIPTLPHQLWQIEQGFVRTLTWDENGNVSTLGIWGPGDVVGLPLTQVEPYYAVCLGPVEAKLLANRCHWSMEAMLCHIQQTEALLQITRGKRICDRLQQLLIWLAQRFGYQTEQGQVTELQITHQEIAETLGTSRVTITRLLKVLEQEGFMRRSRKRYLLLHRPNTRYPRDLKPIV
ncbi:Regulatory protein CysR [Acaryochloris thomasi RCC1774]|uniref:Regulatory protein CysR n=1 Tax=Acaryochloris thomasi RCC1774 TaxID=1764569 RepID=A0A2W1JWG5_9CYAN|nr:Crp/Fnr family transcriptional regulator [Acaryochloris thomasi]PZD73061.1 Regulatory protein CysR [Acaryochloris thomasi RCC1774]